jgi:hypothetical protein
MYISPTADILRCLPRLRSVSIDMFSQGLATQHSMLQLIFNRLSSVASEIKSLALINITRIDAPLLSLVSLTFPNLLKLYLSCTERLDASCCWDCLDESASCVLHSPIPDMFADIHGLAVSTVPFPFARERWHPSISNARE